MQVAICLVTPQCMHLSGTVMEIWCLLTFWGHVTCGGRLPIGGPL